MSHKSRILQYIVAYLLWILSTAFGIFIINLVRETVLLGLVVSSTADNPDRTDLFYRSLGVGAASQWSIMLMGLFVLIILVGFEYVYRSGVPEGRIWRRFFLVTAIECTVLFITHTVYFAIEMNHGVQAWWMFAIPALELLLMGLFFWLRYRKQNVAYA